MGDPRRTTGSGDPIEVSSTKILSYVERNASLHPESPRERETQNEEKEANYISRSGTIMLMAFS